VLGMAHAMTDEETRAFLAAGRRTGKLATTRADGRPHVAPIWFVLDGDDLVFMTGANTVKGKSLRRDPRAALTVDLEQPPYGFVLVEGSVRISTDLAELLPLSIAIARRYVPSEQAEEYGRRNAVEGELLLRLRPDKIVAVADLME
jgi:PPOX class probable F420-dependent enzyme